MKDEWETPDGLFAELNEEFRFDLDICASEHNARCPRYVTKGQDALSMDWPVARIWCNPPYGNGKSIERWIEKAFDAVMKGTPLVVMILPATTGSGWFHRWALRGTIRFLRGRVPFKQPGRKGRSKPPFSSMIVIFDREKIRSKR